MEISFGICVGPDVNHDYLLNCIVSIQKMKGLEPENFEIILCGSGNILERFNILEKYQSLNVKMLWFNENVRPGWITKKKNEIAKFAMYEWVCIVHDYYSFFNNFYDEIYHWHEWSILVPSITSYPDFRGPDWLLNPSKMEKFLDEEKNKKYLDMLIRRYPYKDPRYIVGLDYNEIRFKEHQYISGGFIFCKKEILTKCPLNEDLVWGQAEDVEWSERLIANGYSSEFQCVPSAKVFIQKPNKWEVPVIPPVVLEAFGHYYEGKN